MGVPLKTMMDRFAAIEKAALEKIAEDPTGKENSAELTGVPGSEKDKAVPSDAKKPDEEVAQGQPAGAASTEGAVVGGDAKPLNEGKLEYDQPVLNPDEKAMETSDALTAKTAGLVSDILADILPDNKKAPEGKADTTKSASNKPESKVDTTKSASNKIVLDDDMISKIAAAVVAYNNGQKAADTIDKEASDKVDEQNGMIDAIKSIKNVCVKIAQANGLSPQEAEAAANQAIMESMAPEAAGAAPVAGGEAPAEIPAEALDGAADAGAADADAAALAAASEGAGEGGDVSMDDALNSIPDDVTEDEVVQAVVDMVESGEIDGDTAEAILGQVVDGGSDEGAEFNDEDIANILLEGVDNGEISEDEAVAIAQQLDGEGASEDAPVEDAGAAAADEAAMAAADDVQKEAAAERYAEGFKKRAEELGLDPVKLARYAISKSNA